MIGHRTVYETGFIIISHHTHFQSIHRHFQSIHKSYIYDTFDIIYIIYIDKGVRAYPDLIFSIKL